MSPDFNPFDQDSRKAATKARMALQIQAVLQEHPEGLSGAELMDLVSGRRTTIDKVLRSLWEEKKVSATPRAGHGGGVVWRVAP